MKLVLSIDGGGIRGCIVTEFLKGLEKELDIKISDKFDIFAGTSTGSFIVAGLGYEKMSGNALDSLYNFENANIIMPQNTREQIFGIFETIPKYDGKGKRSVIDSKVTIKETEKDVIITYYSVVTKQPIIFTSWDSKGLDIRDVIDMSSAAPAYFPAVMTDDKSECGIDGGAFANNPTDIAYAEAIKKYGVKEDIRVLSIGCGHSVPLGKSPVEYTEIGGVQWAMSEEVFNLLLSGPEEIVHKRTELFTKSLGHKYLRINEYIKDTTLDNVSQSNIDTLKKIGKSWVCKYKDKILELIK
jgi:uncharacterized protein